MNPHSSLREQQEGQKLSRSKTKSRSESSHHRCGQRQRAEKQVGYKFFCHALLEHIIIEFELDSDELDDPQDLERHIPHSDNDQRMPLLLGLFDSSASQRSLDTSIQMRTGNGSSVIVGEDTINLDELAAKQTAGGGLIDSIANMANSILGAGVFLRFVQAVFINLCALQVSLV